MRSVRRFVLLLGLAAWGCSASSSAGSGHTSTASGRTSSSAGASGTATAAPASSGSYRDSPAFAALRPPGAVPLLEAIERNPRDADAYASAAAFYADSRAAGMTLFWAQTYRLLAPEGPRGTEMADAMRRVVSTRIDVTRDGSNVHLGTHLAPGDMPVLAVNGGAMLAPFAHRYELAVGAALARGGRGNQSLDEVASIFSGYPSVASGGGGVPFSSESELAAYLRALEAAGHVSTYARWVIGPAYPEAWASYQSQNVAAVDAFRAYLAAHPFAPTHGVRPDDLVDIRPAR